MEPSGINSLDETKTLGDFELFLNETTAKEIGLFGGRHFSYGSKTYTLDQIVHHFDKLVQDPKTKPLDDLNGKFLVHRVLRRIDELDTTSNTKLGTKNNFTQICNLIKQIFGHLFFQKSALERFNSFIIFCCKLIKQDQTISDLFYKRRVVIDKVQQRVGSIFPLIHQFFADYPIAPDSQSGKAFLEEVYDRLGLSNSSFDETNNKDKIRVFVFNLFKGKVTNALNAIEEKSKDQKGAIDLPTQEKILQDTKVDESILKFHGTELNRLVQDFYGKMFQKKTQNTLNAFFEENSRGAKRELTLPNLEQVLEKAGVNTSLLSVLQNKEFDEFVFKIYLNEVADALLPKVNELLKGKTTLQMGSDEWNSIEGLIKASCPKIKAAGFSQKEIILQIEVELLLVKKWKALDPANVIKEPDIIGISRHYSLSGSRHNRI